MRGPYFLLSNDPEGGFNVLDTRDGTALAWRGAVGDAAALAAHLNSVYPPGAPAPAWDSLVHEIRMDRIGGEPVEALHQLDPEDLGRMIPQAIGGATDPGLWRPHY